MMDVQVDVGDSNQVWEHAKSENAVSALYFEDAFVGGESGGD